MGIQELNELYNEKLEIRDLIPSIKDEMEELKENEQVKQYIELRDLYEKNKELDNKTDKEVLKDLVKEEIISFDIPNYYVCLGKNLNAKLHKDGKYYILPENHKNKFLHHSTKVALYINFENPKDIIIIPMKEVEKFEVDNIVTYTYSEDREDEYHNLRTKIIESELSNYRFRLLVKSR